MPLTIEEEPTTDQFVEEDEESVGSVENISGEITQEPQGEQALSQEDTDAALAWLENLAAKQGADEKTLFVRPEDRVENPPEWVHQFDEFPSPANEIGMEPGQTESIETSSSGNFTKDTQDGSRKQSEDELPDWLQGFEETQAADVEEASANLAPTWYETATIDSQEEISPEEIETIQTEEISHQIPSGQMGDQTPSPTPEGETVSVSTEDHEKLFIDSQKAISDGKIDLAIDGYNQLVKSGLYLEETIHDLRDALYHFPIDITIWQTLGDAYMRSNRLQDALDAFAKAEDLIR